VSDTRAAILATLRRLTPERSGTAISAEAAALVAEPWEARPLLGRPSLEEAFTAQITSARLGATLDRCATLAELPQAVARYLESHALPASIALQPEPALEALDWDGIETHTTIAAEEPVGVGLARWAIAEAGSLVFHSGPHSPTLLSFLPLHHVVAVEARTIVSHMEDYLDAFARTGEPQPRAVHLITGASGTTDIEGSYVRGAHGPRYLHVVLIGAG
jgi:L-lactate dehydrogenase complex protein LldG